MFERTGALCGWVLGLSVAASASPLLAEPMDLALTRVSRGDCAATMGEMVRLQSGGVPTLQPDGAAWRSLASQLSSAISPSHVDPVITSGPAGVDVALETAIADVDESDSAWERGSRGEGQPISCLGSNDEVRPLLVSERLRVQKGLPLGFSVGASVGKLFSTSLYFVGAELKFSLFEEVWRSRVPDLAIRFALTKSVGVHDYSLLNGALDLLISERFVIARLVSVSPFVGAGGMITRAHTRTIDLTPNIDAVACRDGVDPVCNASGLGASADDLAHDVEFPGLSVWRARGYGGVSVRYRRAALGASASVDLVPPRLGESSSAPQGARQWTVSIAPGVSF